MINSVWGPLLLCGKDKLQHTGPLSKQTGHPEDRPTVDQLSAHYCQVSSVCWHTVREVKNDLMIFAPVHLSVCVYRCYVCCVWRVCHTCPCVACVSHTVPYGPWSWRAYGQHHRDGAPPHEWNTGYSTELHSSTQKHKRTWTIHRCTDTHTHTLRHTQTYRHTQTMHTVQMYSCTGVFI